MPDLLHNTLGGKGINQISKQDMEIRTLLHSNISQIIMLQINSLTQLGLSFLYHTSDILDVTS